MSMLICQKACINGYPQLFYTFKSPMVADSLKKDFL